MVEENNTPFRIPIPESNKKSYIIDCKHVSRLSITIASTLDPSSNAVLEFKVNDVLFSVMSHNNPPTVNAFPKVPLVIENFGKDLGIVRLDFYRLFANSVSDNQVNLTSLEILAYPI